MKINEVAKLTGLRQPTIRLYEERGLVSPDMAEKNGRMFRDYSEQDVARLRTVAALRKALFSMEQIKVMLDTPAAIPALLAAHREKVDALVDELASLKHVLDDIDPAPESADALAAALTNTAAEAMPLPKADISPRFRYLDELYPPEKDDGILKAMPPKPTYSKKWFIILMAGTVLLALIVGIRWVSYVKEAPYTVYLDIGRFENSTIRTGYLCDPDALPSPGDTRTWVFTYQGMENTIDRAALTCQKSTDGEVWILIRHYDRLDDNGSPTIPTDSTATKTISATGEESYTMDGVSVSSDVVSCQDLDSAIDTARKLDESPPSTTGPILWTIGICLFFVGFICLSFFSGLIQRNWSLYLVRFRKDANAGYEAANMIDDPDHVHGPVNTK